MSATLWCLASPALCCLAQTKNQFRKLFRKLLLVFGSDWDQSQIKNCHMARLKPDLEACNQTVIMKLSSFELYKSCYLPYLTNHAFPFAAVCWIQLSLSKKQIIDQIKYSNPFDVTLISEATSLTFGLVLGRALFWLIWCWMQHISQHICRLL